MPEPTANAPVTSQHAPRRLRPRFSIRSALLLTVLVAVGLWLEINRSRFEAQRRTIERLTGTSGCWMRTVPDGPAWLRRWAGPGYFEGITSYRDLALVDGRAPCSLTYRDCTGLQGLSLAYVPVTDDDLAALESLKGLEVLHICPDQITDSGLMHLSALSKLKELQMGVLPMGLAGQSYFGAPRITVDGRKRLQRALPGLKIIDSVAPPGWRVRGAYFPVTEHRMTLE